MRLPAVAVLLLCACSAPPPSGSAPVAAAATVPPSLPVPGTSPPPAAIANPTSPVPAFHAAGAGWQADILPASGLHHDLTLQWDGGTDPGLVAYGTPTGPLPQAFQLEGVLYTAQGEVALTIGVTGGTCFDSSDPANVRHDHAVLVEVQGHTRLRGCGDFAAN